MNKILFNNISNFSDYIKNIERLFSDYELFRKKHFSNKCIKELSLYFPDSVMMLTHSATGALEMVATLLNVLPGDEIILPSFTYVSTANSFVQKGAVPVFIDINPTTLNIDETLIEQAITPKTKAIIAMHYAGRAGNLSVIKNICTKYNLPLVEDAAMGLGSTCDNQPLGSIGDFGVISFDITKHVSAVQGGMLLINNPAYVQRAYQVYHVGTNREEFMRGEKSCYEWVDVGSKYQMNELNAAVLYHELTQAGNIFAKRKHLSKLYYQGLHTLQNQTTFSLMNENLVENNIHEFYLILANEILRNELSTYLYSNNIEAHFHYVPLHLSPMGKKVGRYVGGNNTESIASRLLRLPLHNELSDEDVEQVIAQVKRFFKS